MPPNDTGQTPAPGRPSVIAKLNRPRLYRTIPRDRLFHVLDAHRRDPIIWVAGPPGAGKTSLVSSFCSARKLSTVWLQLDQGESDAATFFHYLKLAGERHAAAVRDANLPDFTLDYSLDPETYARNFARALFGALHHGSVLVLDNYQTLTPESAVHRLLVCVVEEIPDEINLIVISRTRPPPEFARIIAAQALFALSWEDLAFDFDETKALLRLWGPFDDSEARDLHEHSSGWAAGLVLAAQGGKAGPSVQVGIDSNDTLFNYFLKEVFEKLTAATRDVLLRTSFLPSVSAAQAMRLTGNGETSSILEAVYRQQIFVDRGTGAQAPYRFHALFRRFLREQAGKTWSASRLASHLVETARLLEHDGQPEEAARLFIEAQAWEDLIRLVCQQAPMLLKQGRNALLYEWLQSIPSSIATNVPWLQVWAGAARMVFDPAGCRVHLEQAFRVFKLQADIIGQITSCGLVLQSYLAEHSDFTAVDTWLPELARLLGDDTLLLPPQLQAVLIAGAGAIAIRDPEHLLVPKLMGWAHRFISSSNDVSDNVMAGWVSVNVHFTRGELTEALWVDAQIADVVKAQRVAPSARIQRAASAAIVALFDANFDEVFKQVEAALQHAHDEGIHIWDFALLSSGAYAARDTGDLGRLQGFISRAEQSQQVERRADLALTNQLKAMAALLAGDAGAAVRQADAAVELVQGCGARILSDMAQVTLAQTLIQAGDHVRARQVLGEVERGHCYLGFLPPALRAQLLLATGELGPALVAVQEMMRIGREKNVRNVPGFWDADAIARLCAVALEHDIEPEYVRGLIAARDLIPPSPRTLHWPWRLRVYTLGEFQLELDGGALLGEGKGPRKVLALLKAIIAYGGRSVPEQTLIDALWPDSEGDAGHEALKITLLRLRRLLSVKDALEVHEGRVGLNLRRCWVDALAFDELTRAGEGALAANADRALRLYRGSFVPEEASAGWAVAARERLRARFLHLVAGEAARLEAQQGFEQAIALYLRGLDADDLTEEFYQGLMRCYLAQGRPSEGISAFRRLRQVLSVSLGIGPSPESARLNEALRAVSPRS